MESIRCSSSVSTTRMDDIPIVFINKSSNGHPHLWEMGDSKIIPQALVENQSPVNSLPLGDFAVSNFPKVRISTVLIFKLELSISVNK